MTPSKVASACVRCRKQKLKCDVERPCTLCSRAGVECVEGQTQWRHNEIPMSRTRKTSRSVDKCRNPKRVRRGSPTGQFDGAVLSCPSAGDDGRISSGGMEQDLQTDNEPWRNSTSTMVLVEEAFHHHHDTESPETLETSALGYSHSPRSSRRNMETDQPPRQRTVPQERVGLFNIRGRVCRTLTTEFMSLLPTSDAATLLVDNYFNKIHWFMLLFHQREFRASLDELYTGMNPTAQAAHQGDRYVGYITVLLATCALSLRYISPDQHRRLNALEIDPQSTREKILDALRLRLLDILALGSLEAVQTCVLLGSYYLYHGEPELAWPLCGCALRLSQALELHRRSTRIIQAPTPGVISSPKVIEARKRCWWAVHEIETFCSMIYGFPLSISDADCDAEPLDPFDPWSLAADGQSSSPDLPTLLAYKCSMSELSKIVKSAIHDLYGSHQDAKTQTKDRSSSEPTTRVQALVRKVASLDSQLTQWYSNLPSKLKLGKLAVSQSGTPRKPGTYHQEINDQSPLAMSKFNEQLFRLQTLALKFAFENARILIHRPLLSYKVSLPSSSQGDPKGSSRDPCASSIHVCREAALQISCAGSTPIFKEAATTYALNFISLHILTAGVTLCIMASLSPLSQDSLESKLGIRRLMEMQASLKDSVVANQGLSILKKLSFLVMEKETRTMLAFGTSDIEQESAGNDSHVLIVESDEGARARTDSQPANHSHQPSTGLGSPGITQGTPMEPNIFQEASVYNDQANMELSSFCEDLLMTQAMFDVEQAMGYSGPGDPAQAGGIATEPGGQTSSNEFIGYDQGWIWGPGINFDIM